MMEKDLFNKGECLSTTKGGKEHMNKVIAVSVVATFIMIGSLYAADPGKAATQDALAAKTAELNNTEWTIELKSMAGGKAKAEKDTLHFADGKVVSASMEKAGYSASNFTTRLLEDGALAWETMQNSEKDGIAFWRGDIGTDGVMRGVLSKRDLKNNTKDFNFVSTGSQKVAPPAPPAPAPAAPAPVVEPAPAEK
jgi:hypothetical protein